MVRKLTTPSIVEGQLTTIKVSGVGCQDCKSEDIENYQILQAVLCLLTPDTRHLTPTLF